MVHRQGLFRCFSFLLVWAVALAGLASSAGAVSAGDMGKWERSTAENLKDKRYVAAGDRAYVIGSTDGGFPPMGWHIRGEMGGVWAHPIKLLDGYWFALNDTWLPAAKTYTTGAGYIRMEFPETEGLQVTRTEFAPDGLPVVLTGLTLKNPGDQDRSIRLRMDVRSELMSAYPWGWSQPEDAKAFNGKDEARYDEQAGRLTFREPGKTWFAQVGSSVKPERGDTGDAYWGAVPEEKRQDYTEYGNGTGGRMDWNLRVGAGEEKTVWIAVSGSHLSQGEAEQALHKALNGPESRLKQKIAHRQKRLRQTQVSLPDGKLQAAFDWGKLNMEDLKIRVKNVEIRDVDEGKAYPEQPAAVIPELTGIGAGFPDYPWLFGTDGAYTAYPLIVSGQWDTAKDHLRSIRDVSRVVNGDTGKVVHEVVTDGSVYFGSNDHKGNTNETAQFATAADLIWRWTGDDKFRDEMYDFVRDGMQHVTSELDKDRDGWPEGLGMVERPGMGSEKLDVSVYTWQALEALERMARSKGDISTADWAEKQASAMEKAFHGAWWMEEESLFADSLCNEGDPVSEEEREEKGLTHVCTENDQQLQQRHWINATPMETGIASEEKAHRALDRLESDTFTGPTGLYHTGKGGGPEGKGELKVWSLPNSVMANAEAEYGRLGEDQALKYIGLIASELDVEMPGALTEIAPSPEYDPFVDFRERAMFMQAWSSYGIQWPVIHSFHGVRPDIPSGRLSVVPDIPESWPGLSVKHLRVGGGEISAAASQTDNVYVTRVHAPSGWRLTLGHVLPKGAEVAAVTLNGKPVKHRIQDTARGREVLVDTRTGGRKVLRVKIR